MQIANQELHRLVVTAIIIKNGKYLIVQRSHKKKPGLGYGQCRAAEWRRMIM